MKKVYLLLLFLLVLGLPASFCQPPEVMMDSCAAAAGEDATYLKDFVVILPAATDQNNPPIARFPLVLSKSNIYRFSICNSRESGGMAVMKLYDSNRMIFSSYNENSGEEFNPFNFMCQKTGIYHVFISFEDGKPGQAVGILSYVTK
jgi:hypothetical protein